MTGRIVHPNGELNVLDIDGARPSMTFSKERRNIRSTLAH